MKRWSTILMVCFYLGATAQNTTDLRKNFLQPPSSARPWVFWYWMQASVSREGITADLQAMKEAGIGGAYLMPIKGPANPPYMDSFIVQLTPAWWNMVRFAAQEAKRLGLQLGLHVSDGFALAGGPWIKPEHSMQKVVWTQQQVAGGQVFNDTLSQPETLEGFYKDIAVFAYPSPEGSGISTRTMSPVIISSKPDSAAQLLAQPDNRKTFGCDEQCWMQYEFAQPFTCRTVIIRSRNNYQSNRLIVQTSDDGKIFRDVHRLEPPRHGWQDWDADYTHSIPATTAKFFRFVFDKAGTEPGAEDLDAAKWKPSLRVTGIELLSEARIHQYEGKSGEVWRISKATTPGIVPNNECIPVKNIINISDKLDNKGRLNWNVPPGNWTIIRMGHTSTGHKNETAGGGKGLECDKFDPAAVKLQFDSWFGEAFRQIGPDLAKEVLAMLHVDSWECGSQNWSANFMDVFRKTRGYDPLPLLPAMAGIPIESAEASERFLLDIRKTIAELVHDVFYVTLRDLAHKQGVQFSGESVAPTMLSDGMLHYKSVDLPMGEFWLRSPTHDKPNDMLDAISGAHIYGKQIIQAEGFTELRMAWDEHPGMLKALGDRNFALGINRLFFHVFVHNPWMDRKPGMTLDAIGLYFQRDQTWWKQAKGWVDYVTRCQALLQMGKPVTDIAVFTGEDLPRRAMLPDRLVPVLPGIFGTEVVQQEKIRLENKGQPQRELPAGVRHSANMADPENWIDPLKGYAYDSFNEDALFNLSTLRNGRIELQSGASYRLLVVPGEHKMSPNGSKLSAPLQKRMTELRNAGIPVIQGSYQGASFREFGIEPDIIMNDITGKRAGGIAWTHRAGPGFDIYFISNQTDSVKFVELSLRVTGKLPELWDALTGSVAAPPTWRIRNGRTELPLVLDSYSSVFIVLQQPTRITGKTIDMTGLLKKPVIIIDNPWEVTFNPAYGGPAQPIVFDELTDWSKHPDTAIRFYSGTAVYTNTFNLPRKPARTLLRLGEVNNIAEVIVNGKSCGIAWTAPYEVDITKAVKNGNNKVTIKVSNTWANRLIGDQRRIPKDRITNTIAPYRLDGKLLPAGLIGPVRIVSGQ